MGESVAFAFFVSILRTALILAGGWLVSKGLVEDDLMRQAAAGFALLVVTQVWAFWRIHRRALYQRWLVVLGLEAEATTDPAIAKEIETLAKDMTRDGAQP